MRYRNRRCRRETRPYRVAVAVLVWLLVPASLAVVTETDLPETGRGLYMAACSSCHGADGRGVSRSQVGFKDPVPDFTDCSFATREPDSDWLAVAHEGGPARGFSELMPAFGGVLTVDQLQLTLDEIRTFCTDDRWPRGELNLPRPLITEKAYPEDEAVISFEFATESPGEVVTEIVFEKRLGARNQVEVKFPFGWVEQDSDPVDPEQTEWNSALGDMAVGIKHAFYADLDRGAILSVTGELVLPTGDEDALGKGTFVFEPFLSYGQILPAGMFVHGQAGFEIPFDRNETDDEVFLRGVFGGSLTQSGPWGRTWSPMLELVGSRDLVSGAESKWDAVPQVQITLNRRQHIMLNVGARTPINNRDERSTQVLVYLLWDWFDGGLFAGW